MSVSNLSGTCKPECTGTVTADNGEAVPCPECYALCSEPVLFRRECPQCSEVFFTSVKVRVLCGAGCLDRRRMQIRAERRRADGQTERPKKQKAQDCDTCVLGLVNPASDTGWECGASLAIRCKPWTGTPAFWKTREI